MKPRHIPNRSRSERSLVGINTPTATRTVAPARRDAQPPRGKPPLLWNVSLMAVPRKGREVSIEASRPPRRSCTTSSRPQGSLRPTPASGGNSARSVDGRTVPAISSATGRRHANAIAQKGLSTEWQREKLRQTTRICRKNVRI